MSINGQTVFDAKNIISAASIDMGIFRLSKNLFGWRSRITGKVQQYSINDIIDMIWHKTGKNTYCLVILLQNSKRLEYSNFSIDDYNKLNSFIKKSYNKSVKTASSLCSKGWIWGSYKLLEHNLIFEIDNNPAFNIPYDSIQNIHVQKSDINIEIKECKIETEQQKNYSTLSRLVFTLQDNEQLSEQTDYILNYLHKKCNLIQSIATNVIFELKYNNCLIPPGRYDIVIHSKSLILKGRSSSFKVIYNNIKSLYLLYDLNIKVLLELNSAIKRGNTIYNSIIIVLDDMETALHDIDLLALNDNEWLNNNFNIVKNKAEDNQCDKNKHIDNSVYFEGINSSTAKKVNDGMNNLSEVDECKNVENTTIDKTQEDITSGNNTYYNESIENNIKKAKIDLVELSNTNQLNDSDLKIDKNKNASNIDDDIKSNNTNIAEIDSKEQAVNASKALQVNTLNNNQIDMESNNDIKKNADNVEGYKDENKSNSIDNETIKDEENINNKNFNHVVTINTNIANLVSKLIAKLANIEIMSNNELDISYLQNYFNCSYKVVNGVFYIFEHLFIFIPKPIIMIKFNEIKQINFDRIQGMHLKSFSFTIILNDNKMHSFDNVDKKVLDGLIKFLEFKRITTMEQIERENKDTTLKMQSNYSDDAYDDDDEEYEEEEEDDDEDIDEDENEDETSNDVNLLDDSAKIDK